MMNIYGCISFDLDVLASLDPVLYPNLCHYASSTTVFEHLTAIMQLFQSKDKPVVTIEGKAFFLFSHDHIIKWSKTELDCGGKEDRWQSHKIFLLDMGLIWTYSVTEDSNDPVLGRIWKKAKEEGKRCETLWTIPLYDDERLNRAENIAGLYRRNKVSVSHLRKNVIIRFRGQKRANWLYWPDCRGIGEAEATMLAYCHEAIRTAVGEKGYTTFKEMETRVHAYCMGRLYFQQRIAELMNPEEAERQKPFWSALGFILQEKALLCLEVGCEYRQIRKEDREQLSLPANLCSWIIVPKKEGLTTEFTIPEP